MADVWSGVANNPKNSVDEQPLLMENSGAELKVPPISNLFGVDLLYIVLYFFCFYCVGLAVKRNCYKNITGFRQYRLQNLSVCLIHSMLSGLFAFRFLLLHWDLMFNHTMHWYDSRYRHLLLFSTGYFIHDSVDMLRNEWSRWTIELLFHHFACVVVFFCALLPRKFLLYAYWALLMEVNSIFLHIRTISQLNGLPTTSPKFFRCVQVLNMITFIVFRIFVQAWQIQWIWTRRNRVHSFYVGVGLYGGAFFLVINGCLLIRLLSADGFCPASSRLKNLYGANRDEQRNVTRRRVQKKLK